MYDISETVDNLVGTDTFSVTTGAQALPALEGLKRGIRLLNPTGSGQTLYYGISDVTTAKGYPITAGASEFIPCVKPQNIFVIGSGTLTLRYAAY